MAPLTVRTTPKCYPFWWAYLQGCNEGGQWDAIARAPRHCGAPNSPKNFTSTFFNVVHLLPKDPSYELGGAKLASCSGRHLTWSRPCLPDTYLHEKM